MTYERGVPAERLRHALGSRVVGSHVYSGGVPWILRTPLYCFTPAHAAHLAEWALAEYRRVSRRQPCRSMSGPRCNAPNDLLGGLLGNSVGIVPPADANLEKCLRRHPPGKVVIKRSMSPGQTGPCVTLVTGARWPDRRMVGQARSFRLRR